MPSDDPVRQYERDGCVCVRGFLSTETLSRVRRELDRYEREVVPGLPEADRTLEADGKTVRNLWRMERHDPFFDRLACDPGVLAFVRELLHGEPLLMGVETFHKPARVGSGVPPHQDNAYFCQAPPDVLTIWIALDPVTEANGPVFYLKGSHREGTRAHRPSGVAGNSMGLASMPRHEEADVFWATLEPGDALIHHCETIHWSARNLTDHPRRGLLMVFREAHTVQNRNLKEAYDAARAIAAATATASGA
jgi:ectoine hydroxylase-related dioxygenase (phytanoyl-CoA dioxygenase family)